MTEQQRFYKYQILMIMMLCAAFLLYPVHMVSAEESSAREVIRVGYFAFDGYHMMDEDGNRSGYGYDFLRLAARYMDVDFEYIGYDKSWDEMQEMLKDGEIDLLTSMQKTEERMEEYGFSKPIGVSSAMLTVKSSNSSILEQEYDTYNGMKVGMLRNNSRNDDFQKLANEKGFTYQPVYYEMESDIKEALQDGEIDAALTSSLRSIHDERVVEKFATRDFYAVVKKGNTKLLDEINYAIDQMNLAEGDWKDELNYQYYGQTESRTLVFSEKEKEIIRQYARGEKTLTVTCSVDRNPYSYVEDGKLKGIIPDMFAELMEEAGIPYKIVIPKDRQEYELWQKDGSVDIFMDARIASESESENAGAAVTVPYMNFSIAMITKRDFNGIIKKLAVSEYQGLIGIEDNLAKDAERISFESREEAMKAVRDGKADAAFVYLYTAQKFVNNDDRGRVTYTTLEEPVYPHRICIMPSASHELSGILTKCIYAFPDGQMQSLISEYTTYKAENVTLFTILMLYPVRSAAILLALVLLIMYLMVEVTKLKGRHAKLLYALLLDRKEMAFRNGWVDKHGCTYVIYPRQEMMKHLNASRYRVDQALEELEAHDRMVEVTLPYPGKPCQIYVKDITDKMEVGKLLKRGAPKRDDMGRMVKGTDGKPIYQPYVIKVLNTINFSKSLHYNPFAYIKSEKDILKLVTVIMANTKGEGEKENQDFWYKAERLLYTALIAYIWYEGSEEEKNFSTLLDLLNESEVREDDEEYQNPVDLLFEELEEKDPEHFAVRQYRKYKLAAGVVSLKRLLNHSILENWSS